MPSILQLNSVSNSTRYLFAVYLNLFSWYLYLHAFLYSYFGCTRVVSFLLLSIFIFIKFLDGKSQESYLQ